MCVLLCFYDLDPENDLSMFLLKDPVTVHEKATDKHATRFNNSLPGACIADVLRSRFKCHRGSIILKTLEDMTNRLEFQVNDKESATLKIIRCKNKYNAKENSTYLLNALVNVQQTFSCSSTVCEMHLHSKQVLDWNEHNNSHCCYDFFRAELGSAYIDSTKKMLNRNMNFFEEIKETPVFLDAMIIVLLCCKPGKGLPFTRLEIYKKYLESFWISSFHLILINRTWYAQFIVTGFHYVRSIFH